MKDNTINKFKLLFPLPPFQKQQHNMKINRSNVVTLQIPTQFERHIEHTKNFVENIFHATISKYLQFSVFSRILNALCLCLYFYSCFLCLKLLHSFERKNWKHFSDHFFIISNAFGVEMNERTDGKKSGLYFVNVPTLQTICTHKSILSNNICTAKRQHPRHQKKKREQHYRWTETHMCTVLVNICSVVFLSILCAVFSCLVQLVWLVCDLNMVLKNNNDVIFLVVCPFFLQSLLLKWSWK